VIAGIVQDRDYFERFVEPRVDGAQVRYVGPVDRERRASVLGGATALLHLIDFDEPFGFSVVEAMACGTPVVARRRGSMAEIILHGEDGFLVDTVDDAVAAVRAAKTLDRKAVRASVERRFDVQRMVDEYVAVYRQVVG
jgi:glycosyltransferase involved in cell wall biosynthesis